MFKNIFNRFSSQPQQMQKADGDFYLPVARELRDGGRKPITITQPERGIFISD